VGRGCMLNGSVGRPIQLCRAPWLSGAHQTFFVVRQGLTAHDKKTLSCAEYPWRTAKTFSIYVYFNLIIRVCRCFRPATYQGEYPR
jgi:hypothetical protein